MDTLPCAAAGRVRHWLGTVKASRFGDRASMPPAGGPERARDIGPSQVPFGMVHMRTSQCVLARSVQTDGRRERPSVARRPYHPADGVARPVAPKDASGRVPRHQGDGEAPRPSRSTLRMYRSLRRKWSPSKASGEGAPSCWSLLKALTCLEPTQTLMPSKTSQHGRTGTRASSWTARVARGRPHGATQGDTMRKVAAHAAPPRMIAVKPAASRSSTSTIGFRRPVRPRGRIVAGQALDQRGADALDQLAGLRVPVARAFTGLIGKAVAEP